MLKITLSLLIAVSTLTACGIIKPDGGDDAGAAAAATTDGGVVTATASQTATGAGCGVDSTTGATLCLAISVCPNIVIDGDSFPNCGFRVHGEAIDIECACNGYLCPIGSPATCAEATQLMQNQTAQQVCTQISDDRCTGGTPAPAATGSTCDKMCASECGGQPQCLLDCGC